jgi:hypothetical protein
MLTNTCPVRLRGPGHIVQQLKGGDPMSSEKPNVAIEFVCIGSLVEQPSRAI